jgi:hypothetical protein
MANKGKKSNARKWQPEPDDAIRLAALRWYALTIEAQAIQLYATDSSKYGAVETILRDAVKLMDAVRPSPIGGGGDCPPGFVMCGGECAPMCLQPDLSARDRGKKN